jgi:hypothetical protein
MRARKPTPIEELREAVRRLPRHTRLAMLEGIERNQIIAGAYAGEGGICPMLAAHRAGGRTTAVAFARAWDRFAFRDARRGRRARRATERELLVLRTHLRASLLEPPPAAPARQQAAARQQPPAWQQPPARQQPAAERPGRARPGDPDRTRELRCEPGWAWLAVVRRYDDYERALARLEEQRLRVQAAPRERC